MSCQTSVKVEGLDKNKLEELVDEENVSVVVENIFL